MTQIRNTIDLLTKILQANGTTHLKAETFRLAKFDRPEAVLPLWRLLFELVCYCEYGKIDEFVLEAYNQLSSDEVVVYVKRELQTKGYFSLDFARLPKDMRRGSRELLLAFGWLLSNSRVVEKFVMSRTSVLEDDTAGIYADELTNDGLNSSLNLLKLPGDIYSRIKQLLWLNNKLRLNLCSLHSMQCQRSRLKHKIQAATVGTKQVQGRDHLSMLEVYLVRNPEFLKKNIDLLERDSERLHDLLTWKDHDGVFWKWMESVLEAKLQPQDEEATSSDEETVSLFSSGEADVRLMASSRLQESHRTLQEAIVKYEAIVQHIERLCVEKSHEVSSEELDDIISGMSLELSIQKANIALHGQQNSTTTRPATRERMPVEPSFVLEKKPVQPKARLSKPGSIASHTESQSSFTSLLSHNQSNNATTDIDDEIDCMQQHLLSLEKDLGVKQSYLKMEMEKLSGKLNDAVCIPPLNRNLNRGVRLD